jgi:hypothetical protein
MEMGKKTGLNNNRCNQLPDFRQINATATNSLTATNPSCAGYVSFPNPASSLSSILGLSRLNVQRCDSVSDFRHVNLAGSNSATIIPANCTGLSSFTTASATNISMLGQRYLHNQFCNNSSGTDFRMLGVTIDNSASPVNPNCSGLSSFPNPTSDAVDLLDPNNGTGYIQYKMTSPLNPSTLSVTLPNVSLSGDNQTTSTGNAVINFNIPATGCTVNDPCALFDTALTYSPTQALAKRYGGSGSTTAGDLTLTVNDSTRLAVSGYTTTCTFRYKFKSDTTWRSLSSSVAYNASTGCTSTLLTADQLFWNVDFEITAVTTNGTTTKNYLLYNNYDFKAGSIGVTSIGGSGL